MHRSKSLDVAHYALRFLTCTLIEISCAICSSYFPTVPNKVKLSNLKEMAKTIAYIQEHGYDTRDSLEIALYESAREFLKEQSADGQLPSMKLLKAEKEKLLRQKKRHRKPTITTGITKKN